MTDLQDSGVPWSGLDISTYLDLLYYAHSANKLVSPIVKDMAISDDSDDYSLSTNSRANIAKMVAITFNDKWSKLWALAEIEYNPLANDSLTFTENYTATSTNTNLNTVNTTTDKDTVDSGTIRNERDITNTGTVVDSGTVAQSDGIYGFNSSDAVGNTTMNGTEGNTRTDNLRTDDDDIETRNISIAEDTTENRTSNSSETSTNTYTKTTNREGLSNTTAQELITSERELLQWNFWRVVFDDIDTILALDVY